MNHDKLIAAIDEEINMHISREEYSPIVEQYVTGCMIGFATEMFFFPISKHSHLNTNGHNNHL